MMKTKVGYILFFVALVIIGKAATNKPERSIASLTDIPSATSELIPAQEEIVEEVVAKPAAEITESEYEQSDEGARLTRKIAELIKRKRLKEKDKARARKELGRLHKMKKIYSEFNETFDETNFLNGQSLDKDPVIASFGSTPVTTIATVDQTQNESIASGSSATTENEHGAVEIKTWKDSQYYIYGEGPVVLYASIKNNNGPLAATINGKVYDSQKTYMGNIVYNLQEDGIYKGIFNPSLKDSNSFGNFHIKLDIRASNQSIKTLESFSLNTRKVNYNNDVRYVITPEKDLKFSVSCKAFEVGDYLFQASLYDGNDNLIAITEIPLTLPFGDSWVDLVFNGNILNFKKINGPYTFKNMAIYKVNENLSSHGQELIEVNMTTEYHKWSEFKGSPATNPLMHGKIIDLENSLRK